VTFNNEVTVIGDGTQAPQTITGDKLTDLEYLKNNGNTAGTERLTKSVGTTMRVLLDKL